MTDQTSPEDQQRYDNGYGAIENAVHRIAEAMMAGWYVAIGRDCLPGMFPGWPVEQQTTESIANMAIGYLMDAGWKPPSDVPLSTGIATDPEYSKELMMMFAEACMDMEWEKQRIETGSTRRGAKRVMLDRISARCVQVVAERDAQADRSSSGDPGMPGPPGGNDDHRP